jgi:hypothetical protein
MQGRKIRSNHELQHSTALCCAVLSCTIAPPYCRRVHLGLSSRYTIHTQERNVSVMINDAAVVP